MKGKQLALRFCALTLGALVFGAVLAAGFDGVRDASKGQTQAQKSAVKVDKQSPAATKAIEWKGPASKTIKAGDGSVKQ